ncbi:DUF2130 domain-containing protein [Microbulbifer sp. YPW16]|uniref:DUF2130 domain-containing protein n=1 Tax=Microbulbifer sp. YPW16 TaxID=2904242 RepID=UPI001E4E1330|nr:DUF2130 domain-containing protein [Microbulbifer sp. YPW16]UHQ55328.1 DUF2130 domain-containing protein [Microbulbifer sp. YPW16]
MADQIILSPQESITCPHCNAHFPLRDALTQQLIERYQNQYESMLSGDRKALEDRLSRELERKQARQHEAQLAELQDKLADSEQVAARAKAQLDAVKEKAAQQAREELQAETQELKAELDAKDKKLKEMRQAEMELHKQRRELEEKQAEISLELERRLAAERESLEAKLQETFSRREAELNKKIADAQKSNAELTRKLEQGSQQLQGEVLELEIETLLQQRYPFDKIEEVKKGARGADVIQQVHLRSGTSCGCIVWETKRAENWSNAWVGKLKEDLQRAGGDIAVLVTTAFPAGISDGIALHDGIWLVKPALVNGLADALRTVLVESQRQKAISTGKGEQMEALYDYLCSNQFAQYIRSLVETYEEMRSELEREKAAMQRLWKKREGQIGRVTTQVMGICGDLQGIASTSLPHLDDISTLDDT